MLGAIEKFADKITDIRCSVMDKVYSMAVSARHQRALWKDTQNVPTGIISSTAQWVRSMIKGGPQVTHKATTGAALDVAAGGLNTTGGTIATLGRIPAKMKRVMSDTIDKVTDVFADIILLGGGRAK